jgi:glycerate dehydrogenase
MAVRVRSMKPGIVFLDRNTIGPSVDLVRPRFEHEWIDYGATAPEQVVERLAVATIAITNKVRIREEELAKLPHLRMIAVAATGYDVIDHDACRRRGIVVSNVRGYAVNTVPEHTFALILALRRSIIGYRQAVIDGEWQKSGQFCFFSHPISELAGATLGIMGEGAIGQSVARLGQAFGMKTLFAAHKGVQGLGPLYTPFDEVLATSDIITLHCPLTPATRNMIGMPEFRKMRRRPLLINTARGGLVMERDVIQALDEGLISGIGFDCLTSEPLDGNHCFAMILNRPNVIVTPHVGWAGQHAMQTLWNQLVAHIENYQAGRPTNVVAA